MKTKKIALFSTLALLLSMVPSFPQPVQPAEASKPKLAVGKYQDWDDYFDEVIVVSPIKGIAIRRITVAPITAERVRLPDPNDNTFKAVKEVLANASRPFVAGLQGKLSDKRIIVQSGKSERGDGLLVRARITRIDPGSQAARYWASYSAGAAIVEMEGEVLDERSKALLVRFRQERRSGWGLFGGGYHALLDRNIKQIGGDVAVLLNAF